MTTDSKNIVKYIDKSLGRFKSNHNLINKILSQELTQNNILYLLEGSLTWSESDYPNSLGKYEGEISSGIGSRSLNLRQFSKIFFPC